MYVSYLRNFKLFTLFSYYLNPSNHTYFVGLGKAIVSKFYAAGATVLALDCNEEAMAQLRSEFPSIIPIIVNLLDWNATKKAVESILPLNHLVNNAGILLGGELIDIPQEDIDKLAKINIV